MIYLFLNSWLVLGARLADGLIDFLYGTQGKRHTSQELAGFRDVTRKNPSGIPRQSVSVNMSRSGTPGPKWTNSCPFGISEEMDVVLRAQIWMTEAWSCLVVVFLIAPRTSR